MRQGAADYEGRRGAGLTEDASGDRPSETHTVSETPPPPTMYGITPSVLNLGYGIGLCGDGSAVVKG